MRLGSVPCMLRRVSHMDGKTCQMARRRHIVEHRRLDGTNSPRRLCQSGRLRWRRLLQSGVRAVHPCGRRPIKAIGRRIQTGRRRNARLRWCRALSRDRRTDALGSKPTRATHSLRHGGQRRGVGGGGHTGKRGRANDNTTGSRGTSGDTAARAAHRASRKRHCRCYSRAL